MTTIMTPIVRVVRGRGRVMRHQVTIDWAIVGHLAMEAHEDGPPFTKVEAAVTSSGVRHRRPTMMSSIYLLTPAGIPILVNIGITHFKVLD